MAESYTITRTKVTVPRRRADLLTRQRLLTLLEDLLDNRLVILTAPAGYGKTSLLVDFAHTYTWPVCWYALDGLDQDLQRFIAHLIASIHLRYPGFGERSLAALNNTSQSSLDPHAFAALLANEIYDAVTEHFLIVIDDFHLVEASQPVVTFINRLIQVIDENCHIALVSRTLFSLPDLSLMVARAQVGGLSFEDLAFLPEEIQGLLERNYQIQLSDADAEALAQETEGWVTGLLLSTQIMGKKIAGQERRSRASGVRVYDFLAEQIFERQEPEMQSFLLWTALLDEFDATACQEVVAPAVDLAINWYSLIDTVQRRNLFVLPVGEDGLTLRYHHLFQAFLRQRAERDRPADVRRIRLRMAGAYAAREDWEAAFALYRELDAREELVGLVERAGSQMISSGRLLSLATWFEALPIDLINENPRLLSLQATLMQDRGDPATALRLHTQAIEALREMDDPRGLAMAFTRRATAYRYLSQYRESSQDAQAALAILEPRYTTCVEYAAALLTQGIALFNLGQPEQALDWYQRALPAYQLLKDESAILKTYTYIGVLLKTLGRFREAESAYQNALPKNAATQSMVWQANLYNSIALLQHTTGQYPAALASFDQAIQFARASGGQRFEAYVLAGIGDLYLELDAIQEARMAYRQARVVAAQTKESYLQFYLDLMEARLALVRLVSGSEQDELAAARQLQESARRMLPELGSRYQEEFFRLEEARLALAEENYVKAGSAALEALAYFAGQGYLIETSGARVLAVVASTLAGLMEAAASQAAGLLELLPNPDFSKLLAVAAREQKNLLQALALNPVPVTGEAIAPDSALMKVVTGLLQQVEEFENSIPGWRRSVRRHAEVVPFAPPRLHIRALGKVQVKVGETALSGADWQVQTARDLLFLLLLYPEGLTKEQIGELLWPDSSPSELRLRFKNTIYRLRHAAGKDVIVFEGDTIYRFNRGLDYEYDVEDFLKEVGLAQKSSSSPDSHCRSAIKHYRGRYLPDVDLEWALIERERLQQLYVDTLLNYAQLEFDNHSFNSAISLAQQALAVDACHEEAHRLLMRIYAAQHNPVLVIRQYEQCCKALLEELAAEPSPQTRALFQSLRG